MSHGFLYDSMVVACDLGNQCSLYYFLFGVFLVVAVILLASGVSILAAAKKLPIKTKTRDDKLGKAYNIVFASEGAAIGISSSLLGVTDHYQFIIPVIAMVVGLHFIPMAKLFGRSLDYYIAAWSCLVGLAGIYLVAIQPSSFLSVWALSGVGVALATSVYGAVLSRMAARLQ